MGKNHQILPSAFAFIENENTDNWYCFMERVNAQVVGTCLDVSLISHRRSGILAAIHQHQ
jgi:hypothetical protein